MLTRRLLTWVLLAALATTGCRPTDSVADRQAPVAGARSAPPPTVPARSRAAVPSAATTGPWGRPVPVRALAVLHRWDARRAGAYATGSVRGLRDLYVAGCDAGRADVRLLRAYAARGYQVRGLRMQVLALRVRRHRPGRWRLEVTDRLARAVAVGGGRRTVLPRDQASTRVLELVRGADRRWRVAAVIPR